MYAYICYFPVDVRANQLGHAWVPWSIDSFDKYSTVAYFTCIISSHVCMHIRYFLLDVRANQFGLAWVPWRIDSFDKYNTVVYFMHNIISCTHIYNFLWDVRANQFGHAWVPWSIDSFDKYSTFAYSTCIISSHVCIYLLFSCGCSGEPARPCVSSLKYRFLW